MKFQELCIALYYSHCLPSPPVIFNWNQRLQDFERMLHTLLALFSGKRRGKQINFLPAREWAIIYRNLKPLLRPCGDLGEGRLDFYHRSLSKAARRRLVWLRNLLGQIITQKCIQQHGNMLCSSFKSVERKLHSIFIHLSVHQFWQRHYQNFFIF